MAQPAATLRDGKLKLTIWSNDTDDNTVFYSVTLIKSYKDSEDAWQETNSLNGDDMLKAAHLLQQGYSQILELKTKS